MCKYSDFFLTHAHILTPMGGVIYLCHLFFCCSSFIVSSLLYMQLCSNEAVVTLTA